MKRLNLKLLMLLLAGPMSQAATYQDAYSVCGSMDFDSSKNECIALVRSAEHDYFDQGAIDVCLSMDFDSSKNECIKNIKSKIYDNFELRVCSDESFDSSKNKCLVSAGKQYQNPRPSPRPNPPREDDRHGDFVRGNTQTWEKAGVYSAPKGITQAVEINLDPNRATVEIRLATEKARVKVTEAYAITMSGARVELPAATGDLGSNAQRLFRIDPVFAVKLQKLYLEITSPGLIGSRGKLEVVIGTTR